MQFFTDHYFHIGHAHYMSGKPCQDYALSGTVKDNSLACAVVSDGCSSGRHTDVGSRVLVMSTLQAINEHSRISPDSVGNAMAIITAKQEQLIGTTRLILGLEKEDMLATCAYVYVNQNGGVVHLQGDGVVAIKWRGEHLRMYRYDWMNNMPFYPSYRDGGINNFIAAQGGDLEAKRLSLQYAQLSLNGESSESENTTWFTLKEGLQGTNHIFSKSTLEAVEFIAVFSDGVTQIDGVDWKNAVQEFLAFKNVMGDFATRRMRRGIKDMQSRGKGPIDDISYAVIRIEPSADKKEG